MSYTAFVTPLHFIVLQTQISHRKSHFVKPDVIQNTIKYQKLAPTPTATTFDLADN